MHPDNNQGRTWPSPAADGPVSARVRLPASKSITNRALVLAALSDGPAVIANPLQARDTMLAAAPCARWAPRFLTKTCHPRRPGVSRPGNPRRVPR